MVRLFICTILMVGTGSMAMANELPPDREIVVGVNEALVPETVAVGQQVIAVVSGIFPNGCYRWSGAKVTHPEPELHEVRAVASVSQGMCIMVLIPFTKEVVLGSFTEGTHTLRFVGGDGTYLERKLQVIQ